MARAEDIAQAIKETRKLSQKAAAGLFEVAKQTCPKTDDELHDYIYLFFGIDIPRVPCCPDHHTPFDMIKTSFFRREREFAALGSRSSFKTLGLSISEVLNLKFLNTNVVHIGAIDKQAQRGYSYVRKFLSTEFAGEVKELLMSRTTMMNGNVLETLPCTIAQVNGPHESVVNFDEVELANPVAYNEAKGIPVSNHRTGEPPSICYTSTRKYVSGLFGEEMKRLLSAGKKVFTWCYKDVTRRCSDRRSGVVPMTVYINRDDYKWFAEKAPEKQNAYYSKLREKGMEEFNVYDGCINCILLPTCCGDLKRASGIIPIEEVATRFSASTPDFWLAQGECRRPMKKGLMIYNFDSQMCCQKINWKMFLDKDGQFNRSRFLFVGGKDFNWNPDATLLAVIDQLTDDIYIIKEFSFTAMTIPKICGEVVGWLNQTPFGMPDSIQCDKSAPGLIETMKGFGLNTAQAVEESDVEGGCDLVNFLCKPHSRQPMIHVDPEMCPTLIWEMETGYTRKVDPNTGEPGDAPREKNNHFVDCLRYICWRYLRAYAQPYGALLDGNKSCDISREMKSLDMTKNRDRGQNNLALSYLLAEDRK